MESNQTGIEKFFGMVFNAVKNFFIAVWEGYIGALDIIFPHDFSLMIGIVSLVLLGLFFFKIFINRK